ncbi:hypothetical protein [Flavobacterium reichenbachii]|uniref:Uncharacterized protein n=1 Tax=Flavobacterium reichenbachii TaxID=362418 RepID=A0A085ZQG4_9FLAO|nr:hypothetical protein [Flavobacterium reichenbachii]KFF06678.1 hypothetical protein IW19_14705 [Flavobacterium reichenbachii]OXB18717.1 hypothetical protein B0A68_01500 [Flavobacterium reichenbachii]
MRKEHIQIIESLSNYSINYLVVGGWAILFNGFKRLPNDLDIWIENEKGNIEKLQDSGIISNTVIEDDFYIKIRKNNCKIEFISQMNGLLFKESFDNKRTIVINNNNVNYLNIMDIITNKKLLKRKKDLIDLNRILCQ